jgi:hypothetical protein
VGAVLVVVVVLLWGCISVGLFRGDATGEVSDACGGALGGAGVCCDGNAKGDNGGNAGFGDSGSEEVVGDARWLSIVGCGDDGLKSGLGCGEDDLKLPE